MKAEKIIVVFLAAAMVLLLCGCKGKNAKNSSSISAQAVAQTLGTTPTVEKMYPEVKDWVVDAEGYDGDYRIPQFNIESEEINALNGEILEKYAKIESLGKDSGYSSVTYSFGSKNCVASVCITKKNTEGTKKEYEVFNAGLSNGKKLTKNEVVANYGISINEYNSAVKAALTDDFNIDYYSFRDSNGNLYDEMLNKTLSTENIKESIPYVSSKGNLCFVAKVYAFSGEVEMRNLTAIGAESTSVIK